VFACQEEAAWNAFLSELKCFFNVTGGRLGEFLGLHIVRDRASRRMSITQETMIKSLLEKCGMDKANPVPVPCAGGYVFTKEDCPKSEEKEKMESSNLGPTPFRQRSALINFLSCWTRPDVTFTINKLSKFMSNPGTKHWAGLNYLIKYLKGTVSKGLVYDFSSDDQGVKGLHGYTDASYADCPDSAKSTLGYAFFYDTAPVSWYSKLHSFVTTSTNHSEYAALALAAKEAQWLSVLFKEIDPAPPQPLLPIPVYGDSSGVIALVFNPVEHQANKHIRIADHYARELTKEGIIAPHRVPSELNKADHFTKPLQSTNFKRAAAWLVGDTIQCETVCMFTTKQSGD